MHIHQRPVAYIEQRFARRHTTAAPNQTPFLLPVPHSAVSPWQMQGNLHITINYPQTQYHPLPGPYAQLPQFAQHPMPPAYPVHYAVSPYTYPGYMPYHPAFISATHQHQPRPGETPRSKQETEDEETESTPEDPEGDQRSAEPASADQSQLSQAAGLNSSLPAAVNCPIPNKVEQPEVWPHDEHSPASTEPSPVSADVEASHIHPVAWYLFLHSDWVYINPGSSTLSVTSLKLTLHDP